MLLALAIVAALAPRLAPYDPPQANDPTFFVQRFSEAHSPPFWDRPGDDSATDRDDIFEERHLPYDPRYVLGTDRERRDMLSLLLYGTRYSLAIGLLAVALVAVVGAALGLAAGWLSGVWEDLVMRSADLADAVPPVVSTMVIALVVSDPLRSGLASIGLPLGAVPVAALVLSCVGWAPVARLVRGQVLGLKGADWVLAARATGVPNRRIALRHILPHAVGAVLVAASSQLPAILLVEGLLERLEVGNRPPVETLGELIFQEFAETVNSPVFVLMPTALLLAISLGASALSDGVQKALDPQAGR